VVRVPLVVTPLVVIRLQRQALITLFSLVVACAVILVGPSLANGQGVGGPTKSGGNAEDVCKTRRFQLSQATLLELEVEHGDSAISISITVPDSDQPLTFTSTSHLPVTLFVPAPRTGSYLVQVTNAVTGLPENVRCKLGSLRTVERTDGPLLPASRLVIEGDNLSATETPAALKAAITKYKSGLSLATRETASEYAEIRARALVGIGRAQNDLNQAGFAVGYLERALGMPANELATRAAVRVELARSYVALGKPTDAIKSAQLAQSDADASGSKFAQALAYKCLADLYYELNVYETARSNAERARDLFESLGNRRGYAHVLIILGLIASDLANSERAMSLFTQALATSRIVNYRAGVTDALTYSGHVSAKEGRLQEAIEYYLSATDSARELGDQLKESWITSGLAYVYDQSGDSSRALEYYKRTLALRLRVDNLSAEASIYKRLGTSYAALQDYTQAAYFFEKAVALYQHFNQWRFLFVALRDLGAVYESSGQFEKAADYYARAKALAEKAEDPRGLAYLYEGIGRLSERDSKLDIAHKNYSEALKLHRASRNRRGESEAMFRLAGLAAKRGQLEDALRRLDETLRNDELFRLEIQSPDLRASYLSDVRRHYEAQVDWLMQLHKANPLGGFDKAALEASEHVRARSLIESLQEGPGVDARNDDPVLRARAEEIKKQLVAKANHRAELLRVRNTQSIAALNDEVNQLSDDYERVQSVIRSRRARALPLQSSKALAVNQIHEQLTDDTILLEYMLGEERSYVWVVSGTTLDGFELPSKQTIETISRNLYDVVSSSPASASLNSNKGVQHTSPGLKEYAARLSELILDPISQRITGKRIVVVADGALHLVPFATLSLNGAPLIDSYELVSLPSASVISVLRDQKQKQPQSQKLLALFADPVFSPDDPRITKANTVRTGRARSSSAGEATQALRDAGLLENGDLPRLLASRWEADAILAVAGPTAMKAMDFSASLNMALSPTLRDYRMIHLATHAVLDTQRPSLSGVVLSLFNEQGQPQPGYLRAIDIFGMELSADLVTLSACQTAIGKDFKGEGMVGLSRSFMQAGTKRVVASLWKVDDTATAALMAQFYKEIFTNGKHPTAALREAQLTISKHKRWQSPYYWAGFVLQGEWR
jgi:CHAT domain-containing protein/tetratricopeptide (TPR) repeat protein